MTDRTVILPTGPSGNDEPAYRVTVMVPKRRYFACLRERWWVLATSVALISGGTLTWETLRQETYSSYAELYTSGEVQLNNLNYFNEESLTYFGTQIELLKSARLQGAALTKIGYVSKPGEPTPVKLEVTQPMKTSILVLQATGSDANLTQKFLQELINEYLAYKRETRRSTSEDLVASITEQLTQKEQDLRREQDRLADFQRTNNVAVLEEEGRSAGLYLADLNLQLAKLKLDRELLSKGLNPATNQIPAVGQDEKNGTNNPAVLPNDSIGETGLPNSELTRETASQAALDNMRVELAVKRAERDRMLSEHGEMAARRINEEVARLERTITILEQQTGKERSSRLEALDKRIAAMQASLPALEATVLRVNERLSDAQRLKNNVQREQGFYDHLLATLQNVDLGKNVQQERLSVLQTPTIPLVVNRHLPLRLAIALAFGTLLGSGVVFVWYLYDDRFVSLGDLKDQFGDMVMGLVPQVRIPRSNPTASLLQNEDPRQAYADSYRHLRSALLLSSAPEHGGQTLLVTGAAAGEGKTTVAVNLARLLARSGRRVVLIDADVVEEGSKRLMGSPAQLGMSDYLRREVELDEILHSTDLPALAFVPAGRKAATEEGLFYGSRISTLVQELKRQFDFVILDAAPMLTTDHPAALTPYADSILLVVRPFFSRSRLLRQALDMLYRRKARKVSLVLNRARKDDFVGYYSQNGKVSLQRNGEHKPE